MANGENFIKKGSPPEFIEADGRTYVPLPDGGVLEVRGPAVYHPPEAVPKGYQEALALTQKWALLLDSISRNPDPYVHQPPRRERFSDQLSISDLTGLSPIPNPRQSDFLNPQDQKPISYLRPGSKLLYDINEISPLKDSIWIEKDYRDKDNFK